jgi:phage terminase small subunit
MVQFHLKDLNATQAAIRAGYSEKTAYSIGQGNLKKVEIARAIVDACANRSQRTGIDADWVLARLACEADADLADLYKDDGSLKHVKDWPLIWRQGLVAGVDVEEINTGDGSTAHVRKIKISDRVKRLELIGKHIDVQAFKEKLEVDGTPDFLSALAKARGRVTSEGKE